LFGVTVVRPVPDDAEIEGVIAAQANDAGGALIILLGAFNIAHQDVIVAAANGSPKNSFVRLGVGLVSGRRSATLRSKGVPNLRRR
jgi:hypothetical protein